MEAPAMAIPVPNACGDDSLRTSGDAHPYRELGRVPAEHGDGLGKCEPVGHAGDVLNAGPEGLRLAAPKGPARLGHRWDSIRAIGIVVDQRPQDGNHRPVLGQGARTKVDVLVVALPEGSERV